MKADMYIIKAERWAQGYTQGELAKKAGISLSTLLRAEHGADITPRTNRRIMDALGLK